MNEINSIKLDSTGWLEITWVDKKTKLQVYCQSYHPTQIDLLRTKAIEFETLLDDYEDTITDWINSYNPPEPVSLNKRKNNIWELIKKERDYRKTCGIKVDNNWFHSDADSRIQWIGLKDTARDLLLDNQPITTIIEILGQPIQWKTLTGAFIPVSIDLVIKVVQTTKELDAELFKVAELHRYKMELLDNPEEYDWTTDWPEKYIDTQENSNVTSDI